MLSPPDTHTYKHIKDIANLSLIRTLVVQKSGHQWKRRNSFLCSHEPIYESPEETFKRNCESKQTHSLVSLSQKVVLNVFINLFTR